VSDTLYITGKISWLVKLPGCVPARPPGKIWRETVKLSEVKKKFHLGLILTSTLRWTHYGRALIKMY